jgi:hypothetical protein
MPVTLTDASRWHTVYPLQRPEEAHEIVIVSPSLSPVPGSRDLAVSQGLCFHLEVHLCIHIRCIKGDMTQPCPDGVDVHSRSQQMDCRCMSDCVRTHTLAGQ